VKRRSHGGVGRHGVTAAQQRCVRLRGSGSAT
jgi:hypothetical protein